MASCGQRDRKLWLIRSSRARRWLLELEHVPMLWQRRLQPLPGDPKEVTVVLHVHSQPLGVLVNLCTLRRSRAGPANASPSIATHRHRSARSSQEALPRARCFPSPSHEVVNAGTLWKPAGGGTGCRSCEKLAAHANRGHLAVSS